MELEDLILKRFRVEKIEGGIVAFEDKEGAYRASKAEEVERALSTNEKTEVDVLIGRTWWNIRGDGKPKGFTRPKHDANYFAGYRAGYNAAKSKDK